MTARRTITRLQDLDDVNASVVPTDGYAPVWRDTGAEFVYEQVAESGVQGSFLRAFGPDTPTTIPANTWTPIVLDPAGEPWHQFGEVCWEWISPGDPDYALSPAGIRCLKEAVYSFAGAVVFTAAQGTGDRAVNVTEVRGPYAGEWNLVQSMPMPKVANAGVLVSGETYQFVGNIIELHAWSSVATETTTNPRLEWLSVARL